MSRNDLTEPSCRYADERTFGGKMTVDMMLGEASRSSVVGAAQYIQSSREGWQEQSSSSPRQPPSTCLSHSRESKRSCALALPSSCSATTATTQRNGFRSYVQVIYPAAACASIAVSRATAQIRNRISHLGYPGDLSANFISFIICRS